jgi:hypothetical protein
MLRVSVPHYVFLENTSLVLRLEIFWKHDVVYDIQDSDEMNSFHIQISFNSLRQTISLRISNTNLLQYFLINISFLIHFSLQNYINLNLFVFVSVKYSKYNTA